MTSKQVTRYSFSLIIIMLGIMFVQSYDQETLAQLEIPEAKPVENSMSIDSIDSNSSNISDYLAFDDPALGYSISYPNDWQEIAPGVLYGLSAFQAPDGSALTIKFIPAADADVDSLDEFADLLQEQGIQVAEYYKNSTTTLGGLPAFIQTGVSTYTPTVFETLEGKTGYTNRVYQIWGQSEERDGFYGVLFGAASKSQYDETLPVVKDMISSFTVEETGRVTQEDSEENSNDEEPDDTFVGSAGNNDEDNEEQEND